VKHIFVSIIVRESNEYKFQVQQALKQKTKEHPRKNVRGKDRLLKAANKSSCHIRFDGEDNNHKTEGIGNEKADGTGETLRKDSKLSVMDEPESATS
jgi:hypothetical protein